MRNGLQVDSATASDGKQTNNLQALGFDGYNSALTGEQSATLGVNCGMTTGRNGVLVKKQKEDDEKPSEKPVYTLKIRGGCEGGGKGALIQTDKSATLGTNQDQYMFVPTRGRRQSECYSVDEKMGNTYVWEEQANTLASRDYKMPQAVMVKKD